MTTLAARGSGTPATTGTTWASVTNAVDGTAGTNPATYTTYTNATASAVATIEITGYGFSSSIASSDTLNSVTVSLRHFENNTARFASVRFQAFDGATAIGTATTCTLATAARNDTATPAVTLAQLRSATFKIVVTITGAASTQSRVESIDYVDVTADYTINPPSITQAAYRFYADGTETGSTALTTTATLADSYPSSNQDQLLYLFVDRTGAGQTFLGTGQPLSRAGFYLSKTGTPNGTVTAVLYAHTGTFGTGGLPTGPALATSLTVVTNSSLTTTLTWTYFDFDGAYTLANGTPYCICLISTNTATLGDAVAVGRDQSSPTHPGRALEYTTGWGGPGGDAIFEVYTNNYVVDTSSGDVNLQVRTRLQSTTAIAVPATDDWQLQWERNTSGSWTNVAPATSLATSYPDSNWNAGGGGGLFNTVTAQAQSFLGDGQRLVRAGFYLDKGVAPDGVISAALFAHTGTFGTTGMPTGAALATSTTVITASVLPAAVTWQYFEFDRTFTLTNGTPYCIAVTSTITLPAPDSVTVYGDNTSPTHPGNRSERSSGGTWSAISTSDLIFGVYTGPATDPTTVLPYASPNLTDGAATTNRLGAGSGSFVAGKISETGLVTDLGWTANNYTEVLYSVTLKSADLAPTDTVKFRVLRNGATTGLTYTQVPTITIGAGGPTDRTGTATGSLSLSGTATGVPEVTGVATGTLTVVGVASGAPTTPGADVTGVATGQLTLSGVVSGVAGVVGTATAAVAVAGTATGQKTVRGVATGSLTVAGVAVGVPGVTATVTGSIALTSSATGTRGTAATATAALTVGGTATGVVTGNVTGTAAGAVTVAGVAAGVPGVRGVATGSLTLAGTAIGQKTTTAAATGALTVVGTATGVRGRPGTATGSLTITGTASGQKAVTGAATGQIVLTSSALGLVEGNAVGIGSGQITVVGLATGRRGTTATAAGAFSITGLATGRRAVTATVTGSVTITGTATGATVIVAIHTVNVWNGTAFVDAPVKTWNGTAWVDAEAVKTWNGSTFVDAI